MDYHRALRRFLALCVPLAISLAGSVYGQASITARDSLALVSLFDATGGENWTTQDGDGPRSDWIFTGNDPEQPRPAFGWQGVDLDGLVVTSLVLGSVGLVGTLPDGLGNLTSPTRLSLQGNSGTRGNLFGSIPDTLGSLVSLEVFSLANNNLGGFIPDELTNLTNLIQLNLSDNELIGRIPDSLGSLSMLSNLDLSGNQLDGPIPESFSRLTKLNVVNLDLNRLDGPIPAGIVDFDSLVTFRLQGLPDGSSNRFTGSIPPDIGRQTSMRFLYLGFNELEGLIPEGIGRMTQLRVLSLQWNALTGPLPDSITNATSLNVLDVRNNELDGRLPEAIGNLTDLEDLRLSRNRFEGALPASFLALGNLRRLDLEYNRLDSLVDFSSFTDLTQIRLQGNQFTFRDLEPIADFANDPGVVTFEYAPQDSVDLDAVDAGDVVELTFDAGGARTQYTWFRNDEEIDGETGPVLMIEASSTATYRAEARHPDLPLLILYSRPYGEARIIVNSEGNAGLDPAAEEGVCDTGDVIVRSVGGLPVEESECTLRAAIALANLTMRSPDNPHRIEFDIPGSGLPEIEPAIPLGFDVDYDLRSVTPVLIDGTTQEGGRVGMAGYDGSIEDDGSECGLELTAAGSRIRGFLFRRFKDYDSGLCLSGEGSTVVELNEFDDLEDGLFINSPSNIVRENRFVRATAYSVLIAGQNADGNQILENDFGGEERSGSHVVMRGAVDDNIVRGNRIFFAAGAISNGLGVAIICPTEAGACTGNQVVGNEIAVNVRGVLLVGPVHAMIRRNVFVENAAGIDLPADGASSVQVADNWIGVDSLLTEVAGNGIGIWHRGGGGAFSITGNTIVGSQESGVILDFPKNAELIDNRIGANTMHGISLAKGAEDVRIERNVIGNDPGSSVLTGNGLSGVRIENAQRTVVQDNSILGNGDAGVMVTGSLAEGTLIRSNRIGIDDTGLPVGNGTWGVRIDGAPNTTLLDNVISANQRSGMSVEGASTRRTTISGNRIGTDAAGNDPFGELGNAENGIEVIAAPTVTVETTIVAGSGEAGVLIEDVDLASIRANTVRLNQTGIAVVRGGGISIVGNLIEKNLFRGVEASDEVKDLVIQLNELLDQDGLSTGIHLHDTAARIEHNQISRDAGDAIRVDNAGATVVSGNNIFDNAGSGLVNLSPSVTVEASRNWWGDPSGPSGEGGGSGQAVSAGVDASNWLTEATSLALAAPDTLVVPVSAVDSIQVEIRNWAEPDDIVHVVLRDAAGWTSGPSEITVDLAGSGGRFGSLFMVPAGTDAGTSIIVGIVATSQTNMTWSDSTRVVLTTESPVITDLAIGPEQAEIVPGDTLQYAALAFNQFGRAVATGVDWTATGGTIDASGRYIAGPLTGEFVVTASVPGSSVFSEVFVTIVPSVGVDEVGQPTPNEILLSQNYPNPAASITSIPFSVPRSISVRIVVYDLIGREVALLVDGPVSAGRHVVDVDASRMHAGIYFIRLTAGDVDRTRAMVVVR